MSSNNYVSLSKEIFLSIIKYIVSREDKVVEGIDVALESFMRDNNLMIPSEVENVEKSIYARIDGSEFVCEVRVKFSLDKDDDGSYLN